MALYNRVESIQKQQQFNMSSIIQNLTAKYTTDHEKQQQSNCSQSNKIRLQRIAETFMSLIVQLSEGEKLMSSEEIKNKENYCWEMVSRDRNLSLLQMKKIIGQYVEKEFIQNSCFKGLKQQFCFLFESDKEKNLTPQSYPENQEEEEQDYRTYLSHVSSQKKTSPIKSQFQFQAEQCFENTPLWDQVITYLTQIKCPQTQLSYLCQAMGWKLNFRDGAFSQGMFQVIAEVHFSYKKMQKLLKQSFSAKKKKIGRFVSSFKMLKNIYISFPQIWELNEKKRLKNLSPLKSQNLLKLIEQNIFYQKVEPISSIKQVDEQFLKDKDEYINSIVNFKTEFNLLNHQNPGVFTLKLDKVQANTHTLTWIVKGQLTIKYKGVEKIIEGEEKNPSSKIAEENITKTLLTTVYGEYKQILEKMIAVKNKKGIKA